MLTPEQGEVIVRIFTEFANGISPARIAEGLNADGIPGPSGGPWQSTTIRGHAKRQSGILRNRAYIGLIVYGQMEFRKDPTTGKRISVPGKDPLVVGAPDLRIISQDLWDTVAARLETISRKMATDDATGQPLNRVHRQKFLLSGLMTCGGCGGNVSIIGKDRYGCSTRKNKGTCDNAQTLTRQKLESRVLASLKTRLLAPEHLEAFVAQVSEDFDTQQASAGGQRKTLDHLRQGNLRRLCSP